MTKLVRYVDNGSHECWSRVDMDTGENCYISVARTGLIIKESNLGIFGRIVFQVSDVDAFAYLAKSLSEVQYEDLTPSDMRNPVLKVITNEILHLGALDDIPVIFGSWIEMFQNERDGTHESSESLSEDDAQTIVYAFVDVMAKGAPHIGDASTLTYPKDLIGRAFVKHIEHYEMLRKMSEETFRRLGHDEELRLIRSLFIRLGDWHDIDPKDKDIVARLNTLKGPPPDWAMEVMAKYFQRQQR